ncbi:MAG TPA: hypothetical protein PLL69_09765 [Gemmatimonadales bacterium]|nr:hypothetical protein [Gemmatimonadales bacterium]
MKLAVVIAAAFAIGAAAGTAVSPARRAAPETHATEGDQVAAPPHSVPVIGGEEAPAPVEVQPEAPQSPAATPEPVTALIKAVADLPASEAAPMIALLEDSEAVAVLKGQSLSRASEILDAMPRESAARLSRLLLLARAGT